ncbi:MAG: CofC, 2-Phospho-l-lactate Guanylyltransferase [Frankiales bacterium]|nr:CofC, 2-Phospho-l-lactate Guanylyltransferase [Frankiales bacterium]
MVPVKRLSVAKSRLAAYGDVRRKDLALAFAADVVLAALEVADVLVVTDDAAAGALLSSLGATVVPDDPDAGLNPALLHGAELLRQGAPLRGVATLSADLPALRSADLEAALEQVGPTSSGFVSDVAGTGTTLLAAGPGGLLVPAFGPGSHASHVAAGAIELVAGPGLRQDVDTPEDLAAAALLGLGAYTRRAVQGLDL